MCIELHTISTCGHADIPWLQKCKAYNWTLGACADEFSGSEERKLTTRYSATECEACTKVAIARSVMGKKEEVKVKKVKSYARKSID
ncbi:hypothetical protein HYALB_00011847 [Hymenoscyphus albidus]|uniref:Uncharacterized protein n=1 Tax=Hymenoscyphus albidus TaxID=595503 RepID=A0A9N9LWI4_9HELO|nr:hypothetical protein HYALB_00011847 [Hymenoscyphus albidus]